MRELTLNECQNTAGGFGLPTLCQVKCFAKSNTGIALLTASAVALAAVVYYAITEGHINLDF